MRSCGENDDTQFVEAAPFRCVRFESLISDAAGPSWYANGGFKTCVAPA